MERQGQDMDVRMFLNFPGYIKNILEDKTHPVSLCADIYTQAQRQLITGCFFVFFLMTDRRNIKLSKPSLGFPASLFP